MGDIFGAPLALEGLVAFFLESTFIGLWIFGWGRLPKWLHLTSIWLVAIAVNVGIFHHHRQLVHAASRGAHFNPAHRTRRTGQHCGVVHQQHRHRGVLARGSSLVSDRGHLRLGGLRMVDGAHEGLARRRVPVSPGAILGCWVALAACIGLFFTGDVQGKLMFHQQPMKMAAAESLCHTELDPRFSVLTVGTHNNCDSITRVIEVPYVLPFLAEGKFSGVTLEGTNDLQAQYEERFGPQWYVPPNLFVTYWSFRAMIGLMAIPFLFALTTLWLTRRGRVPDKRWLSRSPSGRFPRRSSPVFPDGCSPKWAASPG